MASSKGGFGYRQKMLQANKEAKATIVALVLCVVVWIAGGFGLAELDVKLFGTPLWIIGGTVGTWVFAIAVSVFLAKRVFMDFDLDDEPDCDFSSGERLNTLSVAGDAASSAPRVAVPGEEGGCHE